MKTITIKKRKIIGTIYKSRATVERFTQVIIKYGRFYKSNIPFGEVKEMTKTSFVTILNTKSITAIYRFMDELGSSKVERWIYRELKRIILAAPDKKDRKKKRAKFKEHQKELEMYYTELAMEQNMRDDLERLRDEQELNYLEKEELKNEKLK